MSSHRLVIKDAFWQIFGRVVSALAGFFVLKIISPYLGPLRYGDYSTILKFFAYWSAFADFWLYVIAVKRLGVLKSRVDELELTAKNQWDSAQNPDLHLAKKDLNDTFGKFVGTRALTMGVVYFFAIIVAYCLPAYTQNVYLIWGLPIGMIFSASFMMSGIVQLPLQIFWKMEKLSIALILARVVQILVLLVTVFVLFPYVTFDGSRNSVIAFCLIMVSVLASGITQWVFVRLTSRKLMSLKMRLDFSFVNGTILKNWKYGVSYFLSSFHTLIVLFFLGLYFPTIQGFKHTGIWWLALALLEIFLIVPSALGNSLLHKVSAYNSEQKARSFGSFFALIFWIGGIVFLNFLLFSDPIILFVSGVEFVGTGLDNPWSNTILPFLGLVLWMSFLKQVFNYVFVANDKQNVLLGINFVGVLIWLLVAITIPWYVLVAIATVLLWKFVFEKKYKRVFAVFSRLKKVFAIMWYALIFVALCGGGLYFWGNALGITSLGFGLIPKYGIEGGLVVQILLEVLFMSGAFWVAKKNKVFPILPWKQLLVFFVIIGVVWGVGYYFVPKTMSWIVFFPLVVLFNLVVLGLGYRALKKVARGLTAG